MAKIKIIITGIAMSYHKNDDVWKVIFPFGECHRVKFKESEDDQGIALADQGRQIRVETKNPQSTFSEDNSYENFLDLTADYSHKNGIKLKDGWEQKSVLMSVENAAFSVNEETESPHLLTKEGKVTLAPTKVGYSGKFEIEADEVTVDVSNHAEFPKTYSNDTTLIFDNDCKQGETRTESDFKMLYNIVEDADSKNEEFVAAKIPEDAPEIKVGEEIAGDPVKDKFKDPFRGGLPCHKVRVSKPDNLP